MSSACCRACVCVQEHERYYPTPPHPTPAVADDERAVPVAAPVCVQEHERYYPTPPHPTPAVADDERAVPVAVPVCVQEHERYYPTPPHHQHERSGILLPQVIGFESSYKSLTAASDRKSYCRK